VGGVPQAARALPAGSRTAQLDSPARCEEAIPAFVFKDPFLCALFPQVRLKPWDSISYRLDFLACVRWEGHLIWVDVEIDGAGHHSSQDATRTADLRLPRVKLTEEDVCAPDFMARLQRKLIEAVTT
jgi:hypothetical protein